MTIVRSSHFRNTLLNFLGQFLPLVVGFLTMPVIVAALGPERFSLLTLVWAALGYFTLFDLGFGRATTKALAEAFARTDRQSIGSLYWSSMIGLGAVSFAGAICLGLAAPSILARMKELPTAYRDEALYGFYLLIVTLPVVTLTANARGVMEAQGKFVGINVLQTAVGALSYLAPVLVLRSPQLLFHTILILTGLRVLSLLGHLYLNFQSLPETRRPRAVQPEQIKLLWRFGGWLTISNVVGPILVYFDRFVLGLLMPIRTVGYYTAPVEVVSKLWMIPSSLVRVLFPQFARDLETDPARVRALYWKSVVGLAAVMLVPCLLLGILAKWLLLFWLGEEFSIHATVPLQILTLGVFVNALAWVPHTLLQSAGRTRLIAGLHAAEIPVYGMIFWYLVTRQGIAGAAMAWSLRMLLDAGAMFLFAEREFKTA